MAKSLSNVGEDLRYAKDKAFGSTLAASAKFATKSTIMGITGLFIGSGALVLSLAGIAGLGVGALFKSRVYNLEFQRSKETLLRQYSPLISSTLAQNGVQVLPKDLKPEHLEMAAELNPAFKEHIDHHAKMKRCKMASYIGVSALTVASFILLAPVITPVAAAFGAFGLLAKFGVALALHQTFKQTAGRPLTHAAKRMSGIDQPTVMEAVNTLKKEAQTTGIVTPAQAMGVYVAADPDLAASIKTQFGKSYHQLSAEERTQATSMFLPEGLLENVEQLNAKPPAFPPEELAFRAIPGGTPSGYVLPKPFSEKASEKAQELKTDISAKLRTGKGEFKDAVSSLRRNGVNKTEPDRIETGVETVSSPLPIHNEEKWENYLKNRQGGGTTPAIASRS